MLMHFWLQSGEHGPMQTGTIDSAAIGSTINKIKDYNISNMSLEERRRGRKKHTHKLRLSLGLMIDFLKDFETSIFVILLPHGKLSILNT